MTVRLLIVCGDVPLRAENSFASLDVDAWISVRVAEERGPESLRTRQEVPSYTIAVNQYVPTVASLLETAAVRKPREEDPLLTFRKRTVVAAYHRHVKFLSRFLPRLISLSQGLRSVPAIEGLAVRHPEVRNALEQVFLTVLSPRAVGPMNPVEAWIVSPVAGTTGGAMHRFIGGSLANLVSSAYGNTQLTLNFIRVAPPAHTRGRRESLNTFFGIAADAVFALGIPQAFPTVSTKWFFVDFPLPDDGEIVAISEWERLVNISTKTLMWNVLQSDLEQLVNRHQGIPFALIRIRSWGRPLNQRRQYKDVLRRLEVQLQELRSPNYDEKYIRADLYTAEFASPDLEAWIENASDEMEISRLLEKGWRFPWDPEMRLPCSVAEANRYVDEWRAAIEELTRKEWAYLDRKWVLKRGAEERLLRPTLNEGVTFGSARWFDIVEDAHRARAWAQHLLGAFDKPSDNTGRLTDLFEMAEQIHKILHGWNPFKRSKQRAREAAPLLGKFTRLLAEVEELLRIEQEATEFLGRMLANVRFVEGVVVQELARVEREPTSSQREVTKTELEGQFTGQSPYLVETLNLKDVVARRELRKTWLQLLYEGAQRGHRPLFRDSVLAGVRGLTASGLAVVLGLEEALGVSDLCKEIITHIERTEAQADSLGVWWSINTNGDGYIRYLMLPHLDQASLAELAEGTIHSVGSWECMTGFPDQSVVAIEGLTLTQDLFDTVGPPLALMSSFTSIVKEMLVKWNYLSPEKVPVRKLEVASAGVPGEPIYREVLRELGFSEQDIKLLAEVYSISDGS